MGTTSIFFAFSRKQPLILTKKNSRGNHFFIILGMLTHEKFIKNTKGTIVNMILMRGNDLDQEKK